MSLPDRTVPRVEPPGGTAPRVELLTPIVGPLGRSGRLRFRFLNDSGFVAARSATFRGRAVAMTGDQVTFTSADEGSGTLHVTAQDAAGNVGTWSSELTLDFTPPTISPGRTVRDVVGKRGLIALTIGAGETYPVARSATFRGRAVPMLGDTVDLRRVADGRGLLRVTARDAAGNARTWRRHLLLDRRAPTIGTSRVTRVMGPLATLPTIDRGSGVARPATAAAPRLGRNIASATAVDRAGNRARRTVVVQRHLSLASPGLNVGLGRAGIDARQEHVVDVFSFVGPYAPWYAYRDASPPLVREVQWRLQQFGYLSPALRRTGRLDLPTIRAVQRYQATHGLPALGTVGPRTRRLLDAEFRSRF